MDVNEVVNKTVDVNEILFDKYAEPSIFVHPSKKERLWQDVPSDKLDMLVAEKVMGLDSEHGWYGLYDVEKGWIYAQNIRTYSTDISVAWQVVDKIVDEGCVFRLYSSERWDVAELWGADRLKGELVLASSSGQCMGHGDGMARAICQVSLEAVGVDITDPMYSQYVEGRHRQFIAER